MKKILFLILVLLFAIIPGMCFSGMIIQKFTSGAPVETNVLIIDNEIITDNDIILF